MTRFFSRMHIVILIALAAVTAASSSPGKDILAGAEKSADAEQTQDFATDPRWDGHRNRLVPESVPLTRQDFGYSETRHAGGKQPGEIGGWVERAVRRAAYAKVIPEKTLDDKLTASGTFAVTHDDGSAGTLFGWFNETSNGWRAPNSLAFRIDGNGDKYWVFFEYGTRSLFTAGGDTFEGDRYQTTKSKPFPADGTVHKWRLAYDPAGNQGNGLVNFTLDGTNYPLPMAPGHKADGATFNRFGIFNQQTNGERMEVYFGNLVLDGQRQDFSTDPGWWGHGNQAEYEDREVRPLHDFGYSKTSHAGGKEGEVGGIIWRDEAPAYYGDPIDQLTLNDELYASGKVAFTAGGSDSGVYFGWFNSELTRNKKSPEHVEPQKSNLAILVEGPSRVGHYFRPTYRTVEGEGGAPETGPLIRADGKVHEWSIHYSPQGAEGRGRITVTFDGETQTLDLKPGDKQTGGTFDRFGLFNHQSGGSHVRLYLDDLTYTGQNP